MFNKNLIYTQSPDENNPTRVDTPLNQSLYFPLYRLQEEKIMHSISSKELLHYSSSLVMNPSYIGAPYYYPCDNLV